MCLFYPKLVIQQTLCQRQLTNQFEFQTFPILWPLYSPPLLRTDQSFWNLYKHIISKNYKVLPLHLGSSFKVIWQVEWVWNHHRNSLVYFLHLRQLLQATKKSNEIHQNFFCIQIWIIVCSQQGASRKEYVWWTLSAALAIVVVVIVGAKKRLFNKKHWSDDSFGVLKR